MGSYEHAVTQAASGGTVAGVTEGSPADLAGIEAFDIVLSVDGHPVRDVIDWRWLTSETAFTVKLSSGDGEAREVLVEREWGEPVGVVFEQLVFDGVRTCGNACTFCFVGQLPGGLRDSLYVRDDDYRLSFLAGTFVTLTNLEDADVTRITEQRLSPLCVSVHAVDQDVRRRLVCTRGHDRGLERLDSILAAGIEVHAQIVLVPGVNDGDALARTLEWLAEREPVISVGVVPLGYTAFQKRFVRSYSDPQDAAWVLDTLEPWRERMKATRGTRWAYGADELYLSAGRALPPADDYDGFPQYENGIGMTRAFMDEWEAALAGLAAPAILPPSEETVVLTGELFAPVLGSLAAGSDPLGSCMRVEAVPNRFFGGNVSVTGLLTGRDILSAIEADASEGPFLVPDCVFNEDRLTLDGMSSDDIVSGTGKDVAVVSCDAATLLRRLLPRHPSSTKDV